MLTIYEYLTKKYKKIHRVIYILSEILIILVLCCIVCCCSSSTPFILMGTAVNSAFSFLTKDADLIVPHKMLNNSETNKTIEDVATVDECKQLCKSDADCQYFSYLELSNQCNLNHFDKQSDTEINNPDEKSQISFKLLDHKFRMYDGYTSSDSLAPVIGEPIEGITESDCRQRCIDSNDCYITKFKDKAEPTQCYLKAIPDNDLFTYGAIM